MGINISVGQRSSEILQFKEMKCDKKLKIVLIFITLHFQPFNFKVQYLRTLLTYRNVTPHFEKPQIQEIAIAHSQSAQRTT